MPTPRLFVRWAQFGLLCSHSRMHGDSPREPWYFGPEVLDIVRRYVYLRYQLFPYLYGISHEASQTGLPVIRAMPLAFPEDANTYDKDLQFMLGPWLLVAPIYDEGEQRSVYLPQGRWINYWTGEAYTGPVNIQVHAPLDTLPLFVRDGAILPLMPPARRIPPGMIDPLIVEVYPHEHSTYRLLEDEGATDFICGESGGVIHFETRSEVTRTMIVRFKWLGPVSHVARDGHSIDGDILDDGTLELQLESAKHTRIQITR
jgi:alpha-D-xyloside xylohydrolase